MLRAVRPPVRAAGASSQRSTAARPQLSRVARVAAGAAQQASVELELVALDGAVYTTQVAAGGWLERAIKDAGSEANAAFASVWGCKSQGACGLCAFTVADGADLLGEPTPAEGKLRRLRPPQKSPARVVSDLDAAREPQLQADGGAPRRIRLEQLRVSEDSFS